MFNELRDKFLSFILSRLFVLMVIIFALFGVLTYRLFNLQIVKGEDFQENFALKILKEQSIKSTRGKIYDSKGVLLAYDELAYSVTIEDNYDTTGSQKNKELNSNINQLISIIENKGNKLSCDFNIRLNSSGDYEYAVEGKTLLRFLADVYGYSQTSDLKFKEKTATADEIIAYLASSNKFGVGEYTEGKNGTLILEPMAGYTKEEILKIIAIRYAMSLNSFQKYIATTVATGIDDETVAIIMENKSELQGVDIAVDTVRRYIDEPSMSPILGYTGIISQAELETYNSEGGSYERNDMVGRAGIELVMEKQLQGKKGSRQVYVDNLGKVTEVASETEPVAGNDLYLTIDSDLQAAVYDILEQKLAGIIVSHISDIKEYVQGENESASNIVIPIDDVYYALFDNNVFSLEHFKGPQAGPYEKEILAAFRDKQDRVIDAIVYELTEEMTPYEELTTEYKVYESFIVSQLMSSNVNILMSDRINEKDEVYLAWKNETISLAEYLKYAIANEWIDVTKLSIGDQYADSEEVYTALVNSIVSLIKDNVTFEKKTIKYMIQDEVIQDKQICMSLYEQGVIREDVDLKRKLADGDISPYDFMLTQIKNLEITPAQLALDPCTASCVVTDTDTGEIRACVSYPSYDSNRLANSIDTDYYNALRNDKSNPLYSYATQQKTAPGSTYKIVSSVAGLEEGVITYGESIECIGQYDKLDNPKCWKYPSSHGMLSVAGAITNSCNLFFYEVGYRLGLDGLGRYSSDTGLDKLKKYADLFGLTDKSGIELSEAEPTLSTEDSVRSAIGQGTNSFTTVQLARYVNTVANSGICYDLSVIDKVIDSQGEVIEDYSPHVRNTINISDTEWSVVHSGMKGVVENAAAFKDSGLEAAGKTGTAQQVRNRPNHALFVGYAPYSAPEISIATRIAYGYTSANAAEVARDVFQYYFGVRDKDDILTGRASVPTSGTIGD